MTDWVNNLNTSRVPELPKFVHMRLNVKIIVGDYMD